jgi:hypothetical protein
MATSNDRLLGDAELIASAALPNADATPPTVTLDLGPQPFSAVERIGITLKTTAATAVNAKTLIFTFQHSDAATSGYGAIAELGAITVIGASTSYAAFTRKVKLPPSIKRYLRVSCQGESGGGNASDGTMTLSATY